MLKFYFSFRTGANKVFPIINHCREIKTLFINLPWLTIEIMY